MNLTFRSSFFYALFIRSLECADFYWKWKHLNLCSYAPICAPAEMICTIYFYYFIQAIRRAHDSNRQTAQSPGRYSLDGVFMEFVVVASVALRRFEWIKIANLRHFIAEFNCLCTLVEGKPYHLFYDAKRLGLAQRMSIRGSDMIWIAHCGSNTRHPNGVWIVKKTIFSASIKVDVHVILLEFCCDDNTFRRTEKCKTVSINITER